jgi:hypothetical protein
MYYNDFWNASLGHYESGKWPPKRLKRSYVVTMEEEEEKEK